MDFGLLDSTLVFETLLDKVELVAQCLIAIRHTDLGHVGLADVVALGTLLKVVVTQEVLLLLANRRIWAESIACATRRPTSGSCEDTICVFLRIWKQLALK